jgi:predicted nuclease with RNAse H fold
MSLAVGIDIAARRGCDVVALDDDLIARPIARVFTADELTALLDELQPAVVAIDSPPAWAPCGKRRECERQLTARGICLFTTPDEARGVAMSFYAWMKVGFEMFEGARDFPTFETFPHASAVAIRGHLPAEGLLRRQSSKMDWRVRALREVSVGVRRLRTLDEVDAALCAYTGYTWTRNASTGVGDPDEGRILLPVTEVPDRYVKAAG